MAKSKRDDLRFVFSAVVIALILMAIMHAFAPYLQEKQMQSEGQEAVRLVPLTADELQAMLSDGNPRMLVVYASWCGVCRTFLPDIVRLQREGRLDFLTPVFLSIDDVEPRLRIYLSKNGLAGSFTPYVLQGRRAAFSHALKETGARFQSRIPYVAFFRDGKMETDLEGAVSREEFLRLAESVKP